MTKGDNRFHYYEARWLYGNEIAANWASAYHTDVLLCFKKWSYLTERKKNLPSPIPFYSLSLWYVSLLNISHAERHQNSGDDQKGFQRPFFFACLLLMLLCKREEEENKRTKLISTPTARSFLPSFFSINTKTTTTHFCLRLSCHLASYFIHAWIIIISSIERYEMNIMRWQWRWFWHSVGQLLLRNPSSSCCDYSGKMFT